MRRPGGYATITDPECPLVERDTVTCGHCGCLVFVKPFTAATVYLVPDVLTHQWTEEPGAFCRVCMTPVCLACHEIGTCQPLERQLIALERRR